MKIVDLKTFLSLPKTVLYQKVSMDNGRVSHLEELTIRREPCGNRDWFYSVVSNPAMRDAKNPSRCQNVFETVSNYMDRMEDFSVDFTSSGRDALFEDDALFVIYEGEDVRDLMDELSKCLPK